jgi:hypothetical protein
MNLGDLIGKGGVDRTVPRQQRLPCEYIPSISLTI